MTIADLIQELQHLVAQPHIDLRTKVRIRMPGIGGVTEMPLESLTFDGGKSNPEQEALIIHPDTTNYFPT